MAVLKDTVRDLVEQYWATLLLGFVALHLLVNKYGRGLNSIPGPFLAGFSNVWRVLDTLCSNPAETQIRLHRQLNSHFVRIGPRVVSISDPTLIPIIYGFHCPFPKTRLYSIVELWYGGECVPGLFETSDEDHHARIRKPIAGAYGMTATMDFEPAVDSTTEIFVSRLDRFTLSGEPFDLEVWLYRYAFDV
ncbi:uncharacterized protein PV07_12691, partial [Cladophialophora immunda]